MISPLSNCLLSPSSAYPLFSIIITLCIFSSPLTNAPSYSWSPVPFLSPYITSLLVVSPSFILSNPHQHLPPFLSWIVCPTGETDGRNLEELESLVWTPCHGLTDRQIDQFLVMSRSVGTFARALDCSSSVKQPSLHMSAAAASRDVTLVGPPLLERFCLCLGESLDFKPPDLLLLEISSSILLYQLSYSSDVFLFCIVCEFGI